MSINSNTHTLMTELQEWASDSAKISPDFECQYYDSCNQSIGLKLEKNHVAV